MSQKSDQRATTTTLSRATQRGKNQNVKVFVKILATRT
jgi:hypothetical protein